MPCIARQNLIVHCTAFKIFIPIKEGELWLKHIDQTTYNGCVLDSRSILNGFLIDAFVEVVVISLGSLWFTNLDCLNEAFAFGECALRRREKPDSVNSEPPQCAA